MKNIVIKILISVVATVILLFVFLMLRNSGSQADGTIEFSLYNHDNDLVINDELSFYEGDVLFDVLSREYDLTCANALYKKDDTCSYEFLNGRVLLGIEDVSTDWYNNFLKIYINGNHSNYGVSLLELNDGDNIEIKWTDLNE